MRNSETFQSIGEYHNAMENHRRDMLNTLETPEFRFIREYVEDISQKMGARYPYDSLHVITGEQPYGALGGSKVLGKRVLSTVLSETFEDVEPIELFANLDLVGSEPGFFRLVIPTLGAKEGVMHHNLLSARLRGAGITANGITLPNDHVREQVNKAVNTFGPHYPGTKTGEAKFDQQVMGQWRQSYGIDQNGQYKPGDTPSDYAEAHIQWLVNLEQQLGIAINRVVREGDVDLLIARNGGIEVMQKTWKSGLQALMDRGYEPLALKLQPETMAITPFNLEQNGVRLETRYANPDESLIEAVNPLSKEHSTITMDQALSGDYGFSWKAVPRVVMYSLSGLSGHISGGGSIYNADARNLLDTVGLPYFPIVHMAPQVEGKPVPVFRYTSVALARSQVREPVDSKISLLDFALSCRLEEAKAAIAEHMTAGENMAVNKPIIIPNKLGQVS